MILVDGIYRFLAICGIIFLVNNIFDLINNEATKSSTEMLHNAVTIFLAIWFLDYAAYIWHRSGKKN